MLGVVDVVAVGGLGPTSDNRYGRDQKNEPELSGRSQDTHDFIMDE